MAEFNNPFADPTEDSNPFNDPSVQRARGGQATESGEFNPFARQDADSAQRPAVLPSAQQQQQQQQKQEKQKQQQQEPLPPPYTASAQQRVSSDELDRKQRELEAKARELEKREEEQRRREQQAASANGPVNNWPPLPSFCPIGPCFYQDFEVEIPQESRRLVKAAYYLWIAHVVVLHLNIVGTLAYFIASTAEHSSTAGAVFGVSLLVCIVLTPCTVVCWFRPLYKAFKNDSSFNYFLFFVMFFVQFAVLVVQCLGIDYLGSCGWINGLAMLKVNTAAAGIMLFVAAALTVLAVIDILLLLRVHRIYRNSGASFEKARQEFSQGVAANETVRNAAAGAAADAAAASARSTFGGGGGRGSRY